MENKMFDYTQTDNIIYNLSGFTKLICFLMLSVSAMITYDIRYILFIMIFSLVVFAMTGIKMKDIKYMFIYVCIFVTINFILTFLFSPQYGVELYGTRHDIFTIYGQYVITQEQVLYQFTKLFKYIAVIPLGLIFLITTNPSELASSINRVGVNYKVSYAFSLTLRYFPDMIRDYKDISLAQQSRGLDFSKNEKFIVRVKNVCNVCIILIFSTLDKIDVVTNAMDLRGFGKNKQRTWYSEKSLENNDYIAIVMCVVIALCGLMLVFFVNHSRFWNPFI